MQESNSEHLQGRHRSLVQEVCAVAYFTDPMGDEFRKAIEEAMKEIEEEEKPRRNASKKTKKSSIRRLSRETKKSLK